MNRRTFLGASIPLAGATGLLDAHPAGAQFLKNPATTRHKHNVVWLFADQHRAQAIAENGDPNACTPNIDILARTGVNFTSALSCFPLCSPFRGTLLTSRYPHHCVAGNGYRLPANQPTITSPFREAGYQTAYFGKWHLDGHGVSNGPARMQIVPPGRRGGFDVWVGYGNNSSPWDCWVHGGAGKDAFQYRLPGYETDELTNLFVKYLKARGEEAKQDTARPFFAVLSVEPPHNPYAAPASFMRNYNGGKLELRPNVPDTPWVQRAVRRNLAGYYAAIENWDWNIGRIKAAIEQYGLQYNTYIFVFSDHGDMQGSHGHFYKVLPFEESIRIPLIVSCGASYYDDNLSGRVAAPISNVDIAPMTLGLCGIRKPGWMEGTDYSHYLLRGKLPESQPDSAFLEVVVPSPFDEVNRPWRGLVTRDGWKYCCFEDASWKMFNLNDDPYEGVNMALNNKYRADRKKLTSRLKRWISDTGDTFTVPAD